MGKPHKTVKAILWDNDGILVDTEHLYFEATRRIMESVGIPLSREQYIELFLKEARGAWHLAEERGMPPDEIVRLRDERNALYGRLLGGGPRLMPGITAVLDALHGRYIMGIVTSSRRDHFELIHQSSGLLRYFDFFLTSGDYARTKPDPEPYLKAIGKAGVAGEDCIAIEDSERGLEAARRAGIRCIVVPSALTRGRQFTGACRILESVSEIPGILRNGL
ncbi:MAG TPA: HAD family phosphatase [Candidatus Polarisedimenticolia bacterium]|nr:HAD family phosphatase [Candidatus Polarisedimenticolia bacterium]